MKRRELIKNIGLTSGAIAFGSIGSFAAAQQKSSAKRVLRVAHITDVHIRPEYDAPRRFRKCMSEIKKHKIDFILNGGDTIYAADYAHIKEDRVDEQWQMWQQLRSEFKEYAVYSCLGNHDMWWAAPDKEHPKYGKDYVVQQLEITNRYYSFDKGGWYFIVLDSNNKNAGSLDEDQKKWLEDDLARLAQNTPVLVLSHYPLLAACTHLDGGGMHTDFAYLVDLFYRHKDKVRCCLSGHIHLQDRVVYNNVPYFCNGALSGFWWEEGDKKSSGKGWYGQTPPGYAIVDLFADGTVVNTYIPHPF